MISITAPQNEEGYLRAVGRPDPEVLKEVAARSHGSVKSLLGDNNEVWIGKPQTFDLFELVKLSGKSLDPRLEMLSKDNQLFVIQTSVSFRPAPECQFVSGTLKININNVNRTEDAIALDLFPRKVEVPLYYQRKYTINPKLSFEFSKVTHVEASVLESSSSTSFVKYEPKISAFGVGNTTAGWDFSKAAHNYLRGPKDVFLLLKKKLHQTVKINFDLTALVRTDIGEIPLSTFFLSGSSELPITSEYLVVQ